MSQASSPPSNLNSIKSSPVSSFNSTKSSSSSSLISTKSSLASTLTSSRLPPLMTLTSAMTPPPSTLTSSRTPPSRPAPVCNRLQLQLGEQSEPLTHIVREHQLPRVVKGDGVTAPTTNVPLDLSQPLLVYCERSVRKVGARSVVFDRGQGHYVETGDDILVPEDYLGWFGVLGNPNKVKGEGGIPHFRNICKLAISPCSEFLVGGNVFIPGFTRVPGSQGWESHKIPPGNVLRKVGICQERRELHKKTKKSKSSKKSESRDKGSNVVVTSDMYLHCYDSQDREVLLRGNQEGVFYILTQEGAPVRSPVLLIRDILPRFRFPLLVKLLHGPVPTTPCAFKDTLLLTEAGMSHTVIASTLSNVRNINLEIPLDNDMRFYLAEDTDVLTQSRPYRQALSDCRAKSARYMRNMKVLYGAKLSSTDYALSLTEVPPPSPPPTDEDTTSTTSTDSNSNNSSSASPAASLRHRGSIGVSRMSVISRIITLNQDDQTMFSPTVPPSPISPQNQQSPKTKRSTFRFMSGSSGSSKGSVGDASTTPGQLDPVQDFRLPPNQETIEALPRSLSEQGEVRRQAFRQAGQQGSVYETPNELIVSPEDQETDGDLYGCMWHSTSLESDRSSDMAGIRISGVPGRPSSLTDESVESETPGDAPLTPRVTSWGSGSSSDLLFNLAMSPCATSSVRGSRDLQQGEFPPRGSFGDAGAIPLPPLTPAPPLPGTASSTPSFSRPASRSSCDSQASGYQNEPLKDGEGTAPAATVADSQQHGQGHYNTPLTQADSTASHVYNVIENGNLRTRVVNPPNSLPGVKGYDGTDSSIDQTNSLSGDYMTPLDDTESTNYGPQVSRQNIYEQPRDLVDVTWRATDAGDGCAFFELNEPEAENRSTTPKGANDSGFFTGINFSRDTQLKDHYDLPFNSNSSSFYEQPSSLSRSSLLFNSDKISIYDDPSPSTRVSYVSSSERGSAVYDQLLQTPRTSVMSPSDIPIYENSSPSADGQVTYNSNTTPSATSPFQPSPSTPSMIDELHTRLKNRSTDGPGGRQISPSPGTSCDSDGVSDTPPPLPKNHPMPTKKTLEMLGKINISQGESSKEALILELKKVGLKQSSELALRALQAADMALLMQRGDDLDSTLVALLPKVGQVDLRKIAMCIKSMGIRLTPA